MFLLGMSWKEDEEETRISRQVSRQEEGIAVDVYCSLCDDEMMVYRCVMISM